jgi:hypothetical protein
VIFLNILFLIVPYVIAIAEADAGDAVCCGTMNAYG